MRELRTELIDLINSGALSLNSTFDITLSDGTPLFLCTSELHPDRFGKDQQYLAKIDRSKIQDLEMSLDITVDGQDFGIANVDKVMGQLLTSAVRRLDGAEVILGVLFLEIGADEADAIWDPKIPCELVAGQIEDTTVSCSAVSQIDSVIVSGRTIATEFQWQQPLNTVPDFNPNDNPNTPGGSGREDEPGSGRGRYGEIETPYMP